MDKNLPLVEGAYITVEGDIEEVIEFAELVTKL